MQNTVCTSKLTLWWQRTAPGLLTASWVLGMLIGYFAALSAGPMLSELITQSAGQRASWTGVMSVTILPFLLSAFAVSFSEPWLLLFISTFKAFSFSFCAWGVCLAFGQSGWLVLFLFLFSDFLLIPLQYFYWLRHIRGDIKPTFSELPLFLAAAAGVGCIDFWYIAPFLSSLMQ